MLFLWAVKMSKLKENVWWKHSFKCYCHDVRGTIQFNDYWHLAEGKKSGWYLHKPGTNGRIGPFKVLKDVKKEAEKG